MTITEAQRKAALWLKFALECGASARLTPSGAAVFVNGRHCMTDAQVIDACDRLRA